ncbi:MAG TPA: HEAT repeat domain-containing protein [Planctomycetota bacterium]|nr:HEAT repeat domain-containing protein [Planctomycetota bacterium]
MRTVLAALLLTAVCAAQGIEDWIDTALDERTPPEQRVDALKKVEQTKEGLDKLAEKGLDPARDPEVVHAVVSTLLRAQDYKPYVERICRLLVADQHRSKVLFRIQRLWEDDRGVPLLDACIAMAGGVPDAEGRAAALIALSKIPRRKAAEAIVKVGLESNDEPVRRVAREYVARWFGVATLREAADYLAARPRDSFQDLVEERIDGLIEKEKEYEQFRRVSLENATLPEALAELEKGGAYRAYAARRIEKLAAQNGIQDPSEFARRVFQGVADETLRDPPDPNVLVPLLKALQKYAGELSRTKKPEEVREAIARVAKLPGSGQMHQDLGSAAVGLLGVVDDEGITLHAFAEGFPSVEVKKQAIQQLGQLAQKYPKRSNFVSIKLATLLKGAENVPPIRAQILNLLTQPYVTVATDPVDVAAVVAGYLEKGANPELTEPEMRDCAKVIGKRRTDDARKVLLALAKTHPKPEVRQVAIEEGLLPWAREDETLHAELVGLVVDKDQPLNVRKVVIEALGKRGGRRSALTLEQLSQAKDLDPVLKDAIKEAKLVLLGRLAATKSASADAPERLDLEAACQILERESGGDPERLEPLAGTLVKGCADAKIPAGTARYRYATLYARLPEDKRKEPVLLQRYKDAAENAAFDNLPADLREKLLLDYRELLRRDKADTDRARRAMECSRDLAKLALEAQANEKAAGFWLDAAAAAANLNDAAQALKFLDQAKATGGLVGDLVAREQDLRTKVTKG